MGNVHRKGNVQRENVIYTDLAKSINNKQNTIKIPIHTAHYQSKYDDKNIFSKTFIIYAAYLNKEKLKNILDALINYIDKQHAPIRFKIYSFQEESFIAEFVDYDDPYCDGFEEPQRYINFKDIDSLGANSITDYDKSRISFEGLYVNISQHYEQRIIAPSIKCEYMKKIKTNNPLKCPVYNSMKHQYQFNQENLNHLNQTAHFINEYEEKPPCKYNDECKSFIRSENGGNKMDDRCHMKLFRHPPRSRNIKLSENVHSLIFNKKQEQNHKLYSPTKHDQIKYNYNAFNGYLQALTQEVIKNGFSSDLCLECGDNDECKHEQYSILKIVDEKIQCHRHMIMGNPLNRAQMLALILYTGCNCNYDLCSNQRNGNYNKWKWFDYCLHHAIKQLSQRESGSFSVFTGLNGVKLNKKEIRDGFFVTYVSTSWIKEVSRTFITGDEGMIIQFDKEFKNNAYVRCCDVSWISKFPDECELLFTRSIWMNKFTCKILDETNGIQTVSLTENNDIVFDGERFNIYDFQDY